MDDGRHHIRAIHGAVLLEIGASLGRRCHWAHICVYRWKWRTGDDVCRRKTALAKHLHFRVL